jgi:hypothetical protein
MEFLKTEKPGNFYQKLQPQVKRTSQHNTKYNFCINLFSEIFWFRPLCLFLKDELRMFDLPGELPAATARKI